MKNPEQVKIGDAVTYVDQFGVEHNALVTQVWSGGPPPGINCVYVSDNEDERDQYGRQIRREATSVQHERGVGETPGRFWR